MPAFAPPMLEHMRKMRRYKDPDHGAQPTSHVIDRFTVDSDPKGAIASFQPNGAPTIGHHSVKAPLHIGVPDAAEKAPPVLDIAGLPVFTITSKLKDGPLAAKVCKVTDHDQRQVQGHRSIQGTDPPWLGRPRARLRLCRMSPTSMIDVSTSALATRIRRISSTS